ncbi:MAG: metallophosphoesterase [Nitrososphaeraceae archaeon]|nr:metallophosphoesterase [Nitrososphaeraceae archaeon]
MIHILFSTMLLYAYFSEEDDSNNLNNLISFNILQNSYAIETDDQDKINTQDEKDDNKDSKVTDDDEESDNNNNKNKGKSVFNLVAVGDWDCTSETEDTVENILDQDPELVLALGDFSYSGDADCWFDLIEPIADKTKIALGNHEDGEEDTYMDYFGLEKQYYSFNEKNIHFLALSTETDFDDESEQYEFAKQDLEKYSKDPFIDWIIVFYHQYIYGSGAGLPEETDFRETYHPLFDKYKVDLALQGQLHVYERTYPISFNDDDDDEPIVQDSAPNIYKNPKGTIFLTVGTGGAHDMQLSSLKDFSAEGVAGEFGILNIQIESDQTPLIGQFIENGKKQKIADEFKIIKN